MTAGFRMRVDVWRMDAASDDDVGGAVFTGTVAYAGLPAHIEYLKPSMLLLQQGIEARRFARIAVKGNPAGSPVILVRDEVEVVGPVGHEDIGNRFRVESVDRTSYHPTDSRRFLVLTAERIEVGRSQQ
jgi:hypothetical protein